jgi:hypothetical protein
MRVNWKDLKGIGRAYPTFYVGICSFKRAGVPAEIRKELLPNMLGSSSFLIRLSESGDYSEQLRSFRLQLLVYFSSKFKIRIHI